MLSFVTAVIGWDMSVRKQIITLFNVCSVHRGDTMRTSGDIMRTSGNVQYIGGAQDACGGFHEYIGRCSL